jgi:hypothetical protein
LASNSGGICWDPRLLDPLGDHRTPASASRLCSGSRAAWSNSSLIDDVTCGSVVEMQRSRQEVVAVLRRSGLPEVAEEVLKALPDPVDLEDVLKFLEPYGITKDFLISRLGGSP